jgi:hypothetical protein
MKKIRGESFSSSTVLNMKKFFSPLTLLFCNLYGTCKKNFANGNIIVQNIKFNGQSQYRNLVSPKNNFKKFVLYF